MIRPELSAHPLLTDVLSRQLEAAHVAHAAERLTGIVEQPNNPFGGRIDRSGRCVALSAALPVGWMNTVYLIGEVDPGWLAETVAGYRAAGRSPRVEVLPGDLTPALAGTLADLGLVHQGFHAATYAAAGRSDRSGSVDVRPVTAGTFELFLDTFLAEFASPATAKGNMRPWADRPNWRLYLATVDGVAAAAGVLGVHDRVGYLAAAATVPAFRRAGCHAGLIDRRLADAAALGCELVTGQCGYGTGSHRNMDRAGLRLAYVKAVWSPRP